MSHKRHRIAVIMNFITEKSFFMLKSTIILYSNEDGEFVQKGIFKEKKVVTSGVLKGFRVSIMEILAI